MHTTNSITKPAITILSDSVTDRFFRFKSERFRGDARARRRLCRQQHGGRNIGPFSLTSGLHNTALGYQSLFHQTVVTTTPQPDSAPFSAIQPERKTRLQDSNALISNTTGGYNTANGVNALYRNTTGTNNTANGVEKALYSNTDGAQNTANGSSALFANTTGAFNTATGFNALDTPSAAAEHSQRYAALFNNTSGSNNVAVGRLAGSNLNTGDNNIDIGYNVPGVAGESNTIRIGNTDITDTYIRGISGATALGASPSS